MSEPRYVTFEQIGAIGQITGQITLNRPKKLNAIDHQVGLELYDQSARCGDDTSLRAIVLAGAGRAFCAGR